MCFEWKFWLFILDWRENFANVLPTKKPGYKKLESKPRKKHYEAKNLKIPKKRAFAWKKVTDMFVTSAVPSKAEKLWIRILENY